jgi:ABC-type sulfate transport system permease subunit
MINKGKSDLVIWAIVLCFISAIASLIYVFTAAFAFDKIAYLYSGTAAEVASARSGDIIMYSVDAAINVCAAMCLIFYLEKAAANPTLGKKLFFTGLILNIFASPIAISSILLYIAHFKYPDFESAKDDNKQDFLFDTKAYELKKQIDHLRKLKENGTITEEEFDQELLKLL